MQSNSLEKSIQQQASQCVKCGLCLPYCPTYALTENECESPRGRIALLDALAKKQIPLSEKTQLYLDHCLTCRACEAVCPAKVSYGELIDKGRQLILEQSASPKKITLPKSLAIALKHPWLWQTLARLLAFYQRSGLQYLTRKSGLLKALRLARVEALLPISIIHSGWRPYYKATAPERGQVALFTGCINQLVDRTTIKAAIKLLTACGYNVYIPTTQQCCGALHQHAGAIKQAQALAQANIAIFNQLKIEKIITITTGCSVVLQEYAHLVNSPTSANFNQKIIDINQFLITIAWPQNLTLSPLAKKIIVHTPCTLRNVLKQAAAPLQLLQKIPAAEIIPLAANNYCCGAAGQYMLQHPAMSDNLLAQTLDLIIPLNPDYLATTNIGCNLHLQKGLTEKHCKTRVLHPIVLLAQQLTQPP